ncbi:VOC family protein [Desulfobacter vibrioformis]|uniref:VOC family protein n=1 Tax=Desulfobacter vibrioformis TaxID=34031 RepID=UPI000552F655
MITPKRIDHVCLQVTDLNRSKKYYETLFSAKCWFREDNFKMLVIETKCIHFFLAESKAGHEFLSNQHLNHKKILPHNNAN